MSRELHAARLSGTSKMMKRLSATWLSDLPASGCLWHRSNSERVGLAARAMMLDAASYSKHIHAEAIDECDRTAQQFGLRSVTPHVMPAASRHRCVD